MRKLMIFLLCLMAGSIFAQDLYDINNITTVELTFEQSNWDQLLDNLYNAGDEERLLGSAVVNGVPFDSVGVRYKGNSSYSSQYGKNPLNIKLDYIIDNQKYDDFGTLKLANGTKDPSFVREVLSYEIARNYMPASLANFAEVYINGNLIGLYSSVQDVDKYFKNTHFGSEDDVRFKGELEEGGMPSLEKIWYYFNADSSSYTNYYEIESDDGWPDLVEFLDVFNNDSANMESVLNVDNHLWMLAFDNLLVNLDAPINFGHNFYLFKDDGGRFNPVIWDLNQCFGSFTMLLSGGTLSTSGLQQMDPFLHTDNSYFPIVDKPLSDETYQKMYVAHIRTMIEEMFQSEWYETRADELQDIISDAYQDDDNAFYTYSQFLTNVNSTVSTGGGPGGSSIIGLTQLMDTRSTWLLNQSEFQGTVPDIATPECSVDAIEAGSSAWITAEIDSADEAWLYYRSGDNQVFTTSEMFDDGAHNDGVANDGVFGAEMSAGYQDLQYYVYAQNSDQGSFSPARAAYEFYGVNVVTETGEIVINEINYHSSDDMDAEDWVELYNPGTEAVDISSWTFKDEDDDHNYTIPDYTVLEAGEFLVLCHDSALFTDVFPTVDNYVGDFDFGLSGGGEPIRLFDAEGTIIDSVDYDDEEGWPVEPDGDGNTLELIDPSYDNELPESWQASAGYGSPGEANSTGLSADDTPEVTDVINLHNYPNPFNPTTTISFNILENNVSTKLVIYNSKGQKVKSLLNEQLTAGEHSATWSGKDDAGKSVVSGVYFYSIKSGKISESKKMLLMK